MPKLNFAFLDWPFGPHFLPRLRQQVVGLCDDYWTDGSENLFGFDVDHLPLFLQRPLARFRKKSAAAEIDDQDSDQSVISKSRSKSSPAQARTLATKWHAAPGEISEKMWGAGCVTPGDATLNSLLVTPLNLTRAMSVLDLSAGLGGRMRRAAEETGAVIIGLEPDPGVAARAAQQAGHHAVITSYTPPHVTYDRLYDAFIARELFYRTPGLSALCAGIAVNSKPNAHLAFTDYILDPEFRIQPAVLAWQKHEALAKPLSLVETSEIWGRAGFTIQLNEDLTGFYKSETIAGIKRLLRFLATGVQPDKETAHSLLRRIDIWKYRLAAIDAGLKFYRFYGQKKQLERL